MKHTRPTNVLWHSIKRSSVGVALFASMGASAPLLADAGYNRLSADGTIPILVAASEFSDKSFGGRGLDDFMTLLDSDQTPTVRSQFVIASTGRVDLDIKGGVKLRHPETYAAMLSQPHPVWRASIAARALEEYIAAGGSTSDFDRNADGTVSSDELIVLSFHATGFFGEGGQLGTANNFTSGDGVFVQSPVVIGLGDYATLSTINHELLHTLGAVDLYGPLGVSNYEMSVMGASLRPLNATLLPDPWHRIQFGWDRPFVIDLADFKECGSSGYSMDLFNPAGNNPASRRPLVVMDSSRSRTEFFIIEHRSHVPGDSSIESAPVYADSGVQGTGVTVWSTQTNADGSLLLLTKDNDPANVVDWGGTENGVFATLAVAENGSEFGTGDMIWDQLANPRALKWYDGSDSGFTLTVNSAAQTHSNIGWEIAASFSICPRAPFEDFNEKPVLKFPFIKPLPQPFDSKPILENSTPIQNKIQPSILSPGF